MTTPQQAQDAMLAEMQAKHKQARELIKKAHDAIHEAVAAAEYMGALVERTSRHKRNGTYRWLEDGGIPQDDAKAYKTAYATGQKRSTASDRRTMRVLGIIDDQKIIRRGTTTKRQPKSLVSKIDNATAQITKHLEGRPVSDMSLSEKVLIKQRMNALARLYVELSQ